MPYIALAPNLRVRLHTGRGVVLAIIAMGGDGGRFSAVRLSRAQKKPGQADDATSDRVNESNST